MSSYLGDTKASALSVGYGGSTSESANEAKLTVNGGWLQIHNYGNDLKIGAQNAGWSHIEASGNIYIHAGGDLKVDNSILPYSTLTFDLGSSSLRWNTVYASNLSDGSSSKSLFTMFYMLDNGIGITSITWSALKGKRDAGLLYPGQFYRITDYVTTTTQFDTQSAGHQFDIIVFATSSNSLNENAWAIIHSGDTYFANSKLGSWELKYCLDNDTSRFGWADTTNGKGVIYHMKDEFNNECPYDFKNIQFKRYKVTDATSGGILAGLTGKYLGYIGTTQGLAVNEADFIWCYTMHLANYDSTGELTSYEDGSLNGHPTDNNGGTYQGGFGGFANNRIRDTYVNQYIDETLISNPALYLNNIVLFGTFGLSSCDDTSDLINASYGCLFENGCPRITMEEKSSLCKFLGNNTDNILTYACSSNTFGNECYSNTFGISCCSNTFGNSCYYNTFGNYCYSNTFGISCYSNTFGNECSRNTFGNECSRNTFGNICRYNTFGNECFHNTFDNSCYYNTFGNSCYYNTFGNYCYSNTLLDNSSSNQSQEYARWNIFDNGVQYVLLTSSTSGSYSSYLQNIHIHSGIQGTDSTKKTITADRNLSYSVDYFAKNSKEIILD